MNLIRLIFASCLLIASTGLSAQGVAAPFVENFDAVPAAPLVAVAGVPSGSIPGGVWDIVQNTGTTGRVRIGTASQMPTAGTPPSTNGNGPQFVGLDSSVAASLARNTVALHIDGLASNLYGAGFVVRMLIRETGDETHVEDVLALTDGVTSGNGVLNTGAAATFPGHLGKKEVLIENWNVTAPTLASGWRERTYYITPAFLASNGLVLGSDMCFIWRQHDDQPITSSDGLEFDNVRVDAAFAVDVAVDDIVAPAPVAGCATLSTTTSVSITVRNTSGGSLPAGTTIPVSYSVNGGTATTETLTLATQLASDATVAFTFAATADLSGLAQSYALTASVGLVGDQNISNDALTEIVRFVVTGPWKESFSGIVWNGTGSGAVVPPLGWEQEATDGAGSNSDWFFRNTETVSNTTGAAADHTTGVVGGTAYYAYVNDNGNFAAVSLRTPCIDIANLGDPYLVVWYQMLNANPSGSAANELHVDVVTAAGSVITDVIPALGPTGLPWTSATLDLSPFAAAPFQIRFRGTSNLGSGSCEVCLDDVEIVDLQNLGGQAPRFGLATLDVNAATDANGLGLDVPTLVTGPLAKSVAHGSNLNIVCRGPSLQPVVLVSGPLSIGAGFFGTAIGQIDIGVPTGGIPSGLVILIDGTQYQSLFGPYALTNPAGSMAISLSTAMLPIGFNLPMQAAVYTGGPSVIALTNAVDVTIL